MNFQQPIGVLVFICDMGTLENLFLQDMDNQILQVHLQNPSGEVVLNSSGDEDLTNGVLLLENEIGDIAFHINEMLDEISRKNHLIFETERKLHENELLKNQAELKALQSQINPHFLYNTLQCIRGIAIQHHTPAIPQMTTAMAEIFRYSIRSGRMVPFREEIHSLENYLSIVQVRYQGRIQSKVSIPEELRDIPVLKMILQPIVENAIGHGPEPVCGEKWISIRAEERDGCIWVYLENNGQAIEPERLQMLQDALLHQMPIRQSSRTSVGLSNINDRIKLQYGAPYGVQLESPISGERGVRVTLRFPSKKGQDEHDTSESNDHS